MIKKLTILLVVLVVLGSLRLHAQFIYTVAGDSIPDWSGDGGPALNAGIDPYGVTLDAAGNIYIADFLNNRIRKVAVGSNIITTIAGDTTQGYGGDGGAATAAALFNPSAVALDDSGNIYIADFGNSRIRKVSFATGTGIISTIAGNGIPAYNGDNGPATVASLQYPVGVALDTAGNIYIADEFNNCIRKVKASTGIITTVAGSNLGIGGYSGDGGPAVNAELNLPLAIKLDVSGNIFIADNGNNRIREVTISDGKITTVAGNGEANDSGDDSLATHAGLSDVTDIAVDPGGNLYIADEGEGRIRKVSAFDGRIRTIAGGGSGYLDSVPATETEMSPFGVALDSYFQNLYIADGNFYRVRMLTNIAAGINELKNKSEELKIFPNPCSDHFFIEIPVDQGSTHSKEIERLQVFDLNGKLVLDQSLNDRESVDASNLTQGLYAVRLSNTITLKNGRLAVIK